MSEEPEAVRATRRRSRRPGCLVQLAAYAVLAVPAWILSTPPEVTEDFTGRNARRFHVAALVRTPAAGEPRYLSRSLDRVESAEFDGASVSFLLPEREITIDVGDIHRVSVVEDHGEWQLVRFAYSNTHTSRSIYRAFDDRIEPVSYQMTSNVGQGMLAFLLLLPAYVLAVVYTMIRNGRARRAERRAASE